MSERLLQLDRVNLDDFSPEDFLELYVCALLMLSDVSSIADAHTDVQDLREHLDFELMPVPPQKELH